MNYDNLSFALLDEEQREHDATARKLVTARGERNQARQERDDARAELKLVSARLNDAQERLSQVSALLEAAEGDITSPYVLRQVARSVARG